MTERKTKPEGCDPARSHRKDRQSRRSPKTIGGPHRPNQPRTILYPSTNRIIAMLANICWRDDCVSRHRN